LFAGKLGLALSGGGFRASLFHIGVLAGLAERDMLRHVEVLSCVSGGSILGAYYYLEVRRLLQEKPDGDITRQDYIDLVERLARDFLAGVQQNIRTRVGANLWNNVRMTFQPGYNPTNRLGELYEEQLYARIPDDKERVLRKLIVKPKGDETCIPKYDNWRRMNKVPILVLNATSVNTGHNWQFTSTWMGEPPAPIDSKIDGNYRLRRIYLETEAPPAHRDIRIGQAVAASSCVPGLFTPLELRGLFKGLTVRLVDGGVHDNQGVFGLLDQNCNVMIISDASGQMSTIDRPPDDPLGVLLRTTSLLQARIRTASHREIESRRNTGRLKGLLFLHLKKDLEVEDRDWIGCNNPKQLNEAELRNARSALTTFGVLKGLQRLIAAIRTDLDSFTEIEAYSLMTVGCNMVRSSFDHAIRGFSINAAQHDWRFLRIGPNLRGASEDNINWLSRLLAVASLTGFKIWRLAPALRIASVIAGIVVFGGLLWMLARGFDQPLFTPSGLAAAFALGSLGFAATRLGLQAIVKLVDYRKTLHQIGLGAVLCVFGSIPARIHLKFFHPWFLKEGTLRKDAP
jgi:predicted acylesterase/phospholipase RssA